MAWWFSLILVYLISVVIFHIYIRYLSTQRHNFNSKYPPVIIEPWYCPFLGSILSMLDLESSVNRWSTKYGDNFTLFMFGKYYTVITNYVDLKKYYHATEEMLSMSRAASIMLGSSYPESQYLIEYNVVPYLHSILNSNHLSRMISNTEMVINDYFNKQNGQFWIENSNETKIDLFQFMYRLVVRMNSINFISSNIYKNHAEEVIDIFASLTVEKDFLSPIIDGGKKLLKLKTKKDIAWERWISLLMPDIERCLNMIENHIEPTDFDIIYENVKYSKEELEKRGELFTPRLVAYFAYMSIVPAQHNTYISASYIILEWIRHEYDEIGQRIKNEIDNVPVNGKLTIEYLNSMEYVQGCIYEVIRLHTDFLLSLRHAGEDIPLSQDKFIPSGNLVVTPLTGAKDLYLNPMEFDPERHLKPREEMKADPYRALPFGRGRHACVGERYAKMQIKILLVRLSKLCKMELMSESINYETTINKKQLAGLSHPTKPVFIKISKNV
ncbi:hypothetical protein I4U23_022098 [Adineta vaga]|nr:hypothetical protein I4U23_022098 [Adineta vaga]